jgi:prefoldin subunit 5
MIKNGNWRGWALGIVASLVATAVGSGILFQRETREQLATLSDQVKHLQQRDENIIKYLQQLSGGEFRSRDEAIHRLEQRIERLEKRQ